MSRFGTCLLLAGALLAPTGCAYRLRETGHRDLDRSIRFCDQCCAYAAIGAIWAGVNGAIMWLNSTAETDERPTTTWDSPEQIRPITIEEVRSAGESI